MEELVEEIKNGNKELYVKIVEELKDYLYDIAVLNLTSEELAEDAVQETFLQAYNKLEQLREPKYFKTWITKILINKCHDINEKEMNDEIAVDKLKERIKEELNSQETKREVEFDKKDLFEDLTEKEKKLVNLYYKEGYTTSEISRMLNMNENTVKSFLSRARNKIRLARKSYTKLSRFIIFILAFIVVTSGITFAGRFINNLKEKLVMFQVVSTKGITDAKDYIEKVDTDFVYSNDIGIKIDSVAMDNELLYLSYLINTKDEIKGIGLENYNIRDEKGNLLAVGIEDNVDNTYTSDYSSGGVSYSAKPIKESENVWSYSTTFQAVYNKDYPRSHKIYVEIEQISILIGKTRKTVQGAWKFEIDLPERFYNRTSETYQYEDNYKIKNINTSLNDLSFELEVEFNEKTDVDIFTSNNLILENANGELISCYSKLIGKNRVKYICDISKYSENINQLCFYIKYNKGSDKYVDIVLEK